ncbi:MAG: acyl-CoA carboxylase subunit epsilon [Pedococcus sp.]
MSDETDQTCPGRPPLRLLRGAASSEEIAALFAVLSAVSAADEAPTARPASAWTARERLVRRPLTPGPGAWRASAWR